MRFSSAKTTHWQKLVVGVSLVVLFWVLAAMVAFIPFDRDSSALHIVAATIAIFALIVGTLIYWRWVDLETGVFSLLAVAGLVGLYMVPLRSGLPPQALEVNQKISAEHEDRYEYARALFWQIAGNFTGPTREYLLQPLRIFVIKSPTHFWETRGYMPSHLQAQLYRTLLLSSGRFSAEEVEYRTGRCFNSPHGFVEIAHPERTVYADLWAAINFDEYHFGQVVDMPSCDGIAGDTEPEGEPLRRPRGAN